MKICLFSPSSPGSKQSLAQGLSILQQELGSLCTGLEIVSKGSFMEKAKPHSFLDYIASGDEEKTQEFKKILKYDLPDFIFCCRGGYGALRWVAMVQWERFNAFPTLIGFSDVTVILAAISKAGGTAIHGPMLNTLADTMPLARQALWGYMVRGALPKLYGVSLRPGTHAGKLIGGNLSCLCHLIGTQFEPEWRESILFLEDCNEPVYRIDRMLTHLRLRGVFDMIGGLALGAFSGTGEKDLFFNLVQDMFAQVPFPVVMDLPAGHVNCNMPLMIGGHYRLQARDAALVPLSCGVT